MFKQFVKLIDYKILIVLVLSVVIYFENPEIHDSNAIQEELEHFADCIHNNNTPLVSLKDGAKALAVAHQIIACIG